MSEPSGLTALAGVALLTLLLHGLVFLGLAWSLERLRWVRHARAREFVWRSAVLGGVASAALQLGLGAVAAGPQYRMKVELAARDVATARPPAAAPVLAVASFPAAAASAYGVSADFAALPPAALSPPVAPAATASAAVAADSAAAGLRWGLPRALPWLLAGWLLVSLWQGLRLSFSAQALAHLRAAALPLEARDWQDDAAELARGFAMSAPELKVSPATGSPLATPRGSILLPVWALSLPRDQRRALLAHELAHLRRRDPQWRVVLALWRAVLWPLPLAALAQRRLEALAELECDAAAARALGDGRPLAECLAQCLGHRPGHRIPTFAAAMAAPRSPLLQRAEQLLEGVPMTPFTIPRGLRLAVLAGVIAAALVLPAFVVRVSVAAERAAGDESGDCNAIAGNCISVHWKNDVVSVRWSLPGRRVSYKASGAVRFNPQETALESLAAGATASIEEVIGTTSRRVEYRNGANGLEAAFYLDGKLQPPDAQAEAWQARLLPQLLREAAVDVPARIARLQQRGGNEAVLAEIARIQSDHARGRYLSELLARYTLSAGELDLALAQAERLDSAYEKRQVLSAALDSQQVAAGQLVRLLQSGAGMDSDYERVELLMQAADRVGGDAALREAWLRSLEGLESDFERRRALDALLRKSEGPAALLQILAASDAISSDFERRELLVHVAAKSRDAEAIAAGYARATASIDSDFERREALLALLNSGGLRRDGALAVLDAAAGIASDSDCRTVLVELARIVPDDAQVRQRLVDVASRLSDFEREQVEQAAGLMRG